MVRNTNPLRDSIARRQEYEDGELVIVDTGFIGTELYAEVDKSDNSVFIYTPEGLDDINLNLPQEFMDFETETEINNGIVTVRADYSKPVSDSPVEGESVEEVEIDETESEGEGEEATED